MNRTGRTGLPATTLLVIAKEPVPGRVKTRLTPDYSPEEAAAVAEAALADTLDTVRSLPARRRLLVLEGRTGSWMPDTGFEVVPQSGGGLDERLAHAFSVCSGPSLLIGMDTPQVRAAHLAPALAPDAWAHTDAWFGASEDGGFWALGMADPDPGLLRGVPMSTPHTGRLQRARLVDAGLRVGDLEVLRDVDTPRDAAAVARLVPGSRFGRVVGARRTEVRS
ncbi:MULTISPECIES: DUF2064 domain-containing protein [unclassified Nocardiopsis]|uniref:TIGR04282 family arsenosugar biosynthesis glycosyltransferase n=1 Tax=unclassified Nocardiopsis TaxID=2649073 RepID=UPI0033CB546B